MTASEWLGAARGLRRARYFTRVLDFSNFGTGRAAKRSGWCEALTESLVALCRTTTPSSSSSRQAGAQVPRPLRPTAPSPCSRPSLKGRDGTGDRPSDSRVGPGRPGEIIAGPFSLRAYGRHQVTLPRATPPQRSSLKPHHP